MPFNSHCCVPNCRSGQPHDIKKRKERGEKNPSTFSFPKDSEMQRVWKSIIKRRERELDVGKDRVCELHFRSEFLNRFYEHKMPDGSVFRMERGSLSLKPGAIPTIFPTTPPPLNSTAKIKNRKPPKKRKASQPPSVPGLPEPSTPTADIPPSVVAKRRVLFPHAVPSQRLPREVPLPPPRKLKKESGANGASQKSTKKSKEASDDAVQKNYSLTEGGSSVTVKQKAFRPSILRKEPLIEKGARCSAPECPNGTTTECQRVFRFPSEPSQRKAWEINCHEAHWKPNRDSRICEIHFREDQWIQKEGVAEKILKPNAIPSIFFLPSDLEETETEPPTADEVVDESMDTSSSEGFFIPASSPSQSSAPENTETLEEPVSPGRPPAAEPDERSTSDLLDEIARLKEELRKKELILKLFLSDDQIKSLETGGTLSRESDVEDIQLQLNIGTDGLNWLHRRNYPLLAIVSLNSWLRDPKPRFGVFDELAEVFQYKVQALDPLDRLCSLSVDKVQLTGLKQQRKKINNNSSDDSVTVVMVRGIHSPWEQVVACESHSSAADCSSQRVLLEKSISFAEECGLRVLCVSSDYDDFSLMWSSLGVEVTKNVSEQTASFVFSDHEIHVVPDVHHLLRSLKTAVDTGIQLPLSLVEDEALPSRQVSTKHVYQLWNSGNSKSSTLLSHLCKEDVKSSQNKTSTESAVRFFSIKTAVALENAVTSNLITPDALSTAYFCRLIDKWYTICDSRSPVDAISKENKQASLNFLGTFTRIIQSVRIGDGWSPIKSGMIMSSMSVSKVVDILLQQDGFGGVVLRLFSLDALEEVIREVHQKPGADLSTPAFFRELKAVTSRQFTSEGVEASSSEVSVPVQKSTAREQLQRRPLPKEKSVILKARVASELDSKEELSRPRKKSAKS